MTRKVYKFRAQVWRWPGVGGWHFVNLPEKISSGIRSKYGKGMIKILAKTGKSSWNTSLFPHKNSKGEFGYLISVKNIIRKKENVFNGDAVTVSFDII